MFCEFLERNKNLKTPFFNLKNFESSKVSKIEKKKHAFENPVGGRGCFQFFCFPENCWKVARDDSLTTMTT